MRFDIEDWSEIRLDINSNVNPDIVRSLVDTSSVKTNSVDAIYSAHNLEHIYLHEVPIALNELFRILNEDGMVVLRYPDLKQISRVFANDKLLDPLYNFLEAQYH